MHNLPENQFLDKRRRLYTITKYVIIIAVIILIVALYYSFFYYFRRHDSNSSSGSNSQEEDSTHQQQSQQQHFSKSALSSISDASSRYDFSLPVKHPLPLMRPRIMKFQLPPEREKLLQENLQKQEQEEEVGSDSSSNTNNENAEQQQQQHDLNLIRQKTLFDSGGRKLQGWKTNLDGKNNNNNNNKKFAGLKVFQIDPAKTGALPLISDFTKSTVGNIVFAGKKGKADSVVWRVISNQQQPRILLLNHISFGNDLVDFFRRSLQTSSKSTLKVMPLISSSSSNSQINNNKVQRKHFKEIIDSIKFKISIVLGFQSGSVAFKKSLGPLTLLSVVVVPTTSSDNNNDGEDSVEDKIRGKVLTLCNNNNKVHASSSSTNNKEGVDKKAIAVALFPLSENTNNNNDNKNNNNRDEENDAMIIYFVDENLQDEINLSSAFSRESLKQIKSGRGDEGEQSRMKAYAAMCIFL